MRSHAGTPVGALAQGWGGGVGERGSLRTRGLPQLGQRRRSAPRCLKDESMRREARPTVLGACVPKYRLHASSLADLWRFPRSP